MGDFLTFRRMITPIIIQVLFWVGIAAVLITGLIMLTQEPFLGLLIIVLGPIAVRIYCEILILFFRMNETLTDIDEQLHLNAAPSRPVVPPSQPGWATAPAGQPRLP